MSHWDGNERRQQTSNEIMLLDRRIALLEENLNGINQIKTDVAVLTELVNNGITEKLNSIKIDVSELKNSFISLDKTTILMVNTANERITKLPCETRLGWYRSMTYQIKVLWGFVIAIVLLIVGEWIKKR